MAFVLLNVSQRKIIYKREYDAYNPKNYDDLVGIIKREVPGAITETILGIKQPSGPNFQGGIGNVDSRGGDYKFDEKVYVVSLSTEPSGASLSFDGLPNPNCTRTPCKIELGEGNVRIIAVLEQYKRADTTTLIKQNDQSINIKLKPNFGVLEIKAAFLEGLSICR